jgi:flagellar protein FliJ
VPKFAFRLDPVLGHRERIEQERAGEHAQALSDQRVAERLRDDFIARRDEMRSQLTREHAGLDGETLRATYVHLDYLDRTIAAARQRVDACVAEAERARQRLVSAARDRKVLETLKDRRREAHDLDASIAEQRELDDLNARLHDRAHPLEGSPS